MIIVLKDFYDIMESTLIVCRQRTFPASSFIKMIDRIEEIINEGRFPLKKEYMTPQSKHYIDNIRQIRKELLEISESEGD